MRSDSAPGFAGPETRTGTGNAPAPGRRTAVPAAVAAGLWVLAQIAYPLTTGATRDRVTVVVVLLSAATALLHAWSVRGFRWAATVFVILAGSGLLAEVVGTASGYPFGCYDYASGRLGPAVAGVPLVVPLAWTGGLYPVWVVARRLCGSVPGRILVTAAGAIGWDLFLDPQMVSDGQWTWCAAHSGIPGLPAIPWTNYVGWFGVSLLLAVLLESFGPEVAAPGRAAASRFPADAVPIAVFLWTWLGSTLAHAVFLGLPASAGYGFAGLGLLGVPLLARRRRHRRPARAAR